MKKRFLQNYPKPVETYRNQVLQHNLTMKPRVADVRVNKCCYKDVLTGITEQTTGGQDKLIRHLYKDCLLCRIKNSSKVFINANFVNNTVKSRIRLPMAVNFHRAWALVLDVFENFRSLPACRRLEIGDDCTQAIPKSARIGNSFLIR